MRFNEGDRVYVIGSQHLSMTRGVVDRVTKTHAIVKNAKGVESRYRRDSGRLVGAGTWNTAHIEHATEASDERYAVHVQRRRAALLSDLFRRHSRGDEKSYARIVEEFEKWRAAEEGQA